MRAGWWALIVGLVVGGGLALVLALPAVPLDDGQGPVLRALGLERGPRLDAWRARAVAAATERCLASAGIRMSVPVEPAPAIPDAALDPVAWAERWGFGITTAASMPMIPPIEGAAPGPLEVRCRETAADAVYGLRERALRPLRPALEALAASIDADPASAAADRAWLACAGRATRALDPPPSPPTAPGDLDAARWWFADRASRPGPEVIALERRVAAAVARCDLARVAARQVAALPHERAFVRAHAAELARIGDLIRAAEADDPRVSP